MLLSLSVEADAAKPLRPAKGASVVQSAPKMPADTIDRLQSGDPARIQSALDDVRVAGRSAVLAVPVIESLLRQGLSLPLTEAAIETLGETESEQASEILCWYSRHRELAVRKVAVQALAHAQGPETVRALRTALSDTEPSVRGLAATALGSIKAQDAVPDLLVALEHHVNEAAGALGQVCASSECENLVNQLGRIPFDVVTSGLEPMLLRPAPDVSDDLKLRIIARCRSLGTAAAHRFLLGVQARWPAGREASARQALDDAVRATAAALGRRRALGVHE
jgi:HEAT repeat protein